MKLCIRAHDLGVTGTENILRRLNELDLDGVQLVCYKAYDDIPYVPGAITVEKAETIGKAFREAGKVVPLVGAYFNPVHSDREKAQRCENIFGEYLRVCRLLGSGVVGSETGSFNDDSWTYHPRNRTEEAVNAVAESFSRLCDIAAQSGSIVAMEGAEGHVCFAPETLAEARKKVGKPTKVIFDLYNYMDADNQLDYLGILKRGLELFAGDILLFHMKDCNFTPGSKPHQMPFGKGELDKRAILKAIKDYDKDAVLVLEETTGEDIPFAVQTIRTIWESI